MEDTLKALSEAKDTAGVWLEAFFKNPKPTEMDFKKARLATSHRATQVRAFMAITSKDRIRFSLARVITSDPEELAKYLQASTVPGREIMK